MIITLPKSTLSGKGSSTNFEKVVGQALTDHVQNMIAQGGEAFVAAVKTNLDFDEFTSNLRGLIQGLDDDILKLEASKVDVDEPSEKIMDLELKHAILEERERLLEDYRGRFEARVQLHSAVRRSSSPSRVKTPRSSGDHQDDEEDDQDVQPEDWEGSTEHMRCEVELDQFSSRTRDAMEKQYLKEFKLAREAKKNRAQAGVKIAEIKVSIVRTQVVEILVTEFKNLKTVIVNKIRGAIAEHSTLRTRLNQNVLVCGAAIEAPYEYNNLSGMYQILLDTYSKASISFMCDYLLDLMSLEVSADNVERNPEVMLTKMAPKIKMYNDMRLSEYLTQDMITVVFTLKAYPQSTRQDILQHLYIELQARENDPGRAIRAESHPGMAMYSIVVNYITEILVKAKQFTPVEKVKDKEPWRQKVKPTDPGLESAAYGQEYGSGGGSGGGFEKTPRDRKYATGVYRGEVTRAQSLWINIRGKDHQMRELTYTATNHPCSDCTHKPKCFQGQCFKCGKYGHMDTQCRQHPSETSGGGGGGHKG